MEFQRSSEGSRQPKRVRSRSHSAQQHLVPILIQFGGPKTHANPATVAPSLLTVAAKPGVNDPCSTDQAKLDNFERFTTAAAAVE